VRPVGLPEITNLRYKVPVPERERAEAKFDAYAEDYERLWRANIRASGEAPEYFAAYKLACLGRIGIAGAGPCLDYGCGIGTLTQLLCSAFADVAGFDPSPKSLAVAKQRAPRARFYEEAGAIPVAHFATAVLSGVLHHVPPNERDALLTTAGSKLRSGGKLVVFEHNPYNPLTVHAVKTCPFDDDAILLPRAEIARRLKAAGLIVERSEYIVFFPRPLRALRPLEPHLSWLGLGAQTMTVARKPDHTIHS
jgi:SAM-dependent methyltransferase